MIFNSNANVVSLLNKYTGCNGYQLTGGAAATLTDNAATLIPVAGTLTNLYYASDVNAGATTNTITIVKNGVATALTCGITTGNSSAHDTTDAVAVVAGDLISIHYTGAVDANYPQVSFEFAPNS